MTSRTRTRLSLLVVVLMAMSLAAVSPATGSEIADAPDTVFAEATERSSATLPLEASRVERSRQVTLASGAADRLQTSRSALVFNLFDDLSISVSGSVDRVTPGGFAWSGTTADGGDVLVVMNGSDMTAHANVGGVIYEIRPLGGGAHAVIEVDPAGDVDEEEIDLPPVVGDEPATQMVITGGTARVGEPVDLMILWTPAAESKAGGAANMQALVSLMISQTSTIYGNSNVSTGVNLAHSQKVTYTENAAGGSADLRELACNGNSLDATFGAGFCASPTYIDNVHALRDTHGADLVSLIVDQPSFGGVAYTPSALGNWWETDGRLAFSVIDIDAATSQYSYTHEIDHNQAAMHDRAASQAGPGDYASYAAGHINNGVYRTVMAYSTGCPSGCTRQMVLSNPDVSFNVGGTFYPTSNGPTLEDNARVVDEFATQVSSYRAAAVTYKCNGLTATKVGTASGETINGTTGPDVIVGLGGNDIINGLGGNDTICAGNGNDTVNAGNGRDKVFGEGGHDTINGDGGDDTLKGGLGNDTISGGNGDDTVNGDGGADNLFGDADHDTINGGNGNDTIHGGTGDDTINGGDGDDTANGGNGRDVINGDADIDTLKGDGGNDTIYGGGGDDVIEGGANDDKLYGNGGKDNIVGDDGNDKAWGGIGNDRIDGKKGADILVGDGGSDILLGALGDDTLTGSDGNDRIRGGPGEDTLNGSAGNDKLFGQDHNDLLLGHAGDDYLNGGPGIDTLRGGPHNVGDTCGRGPNFATCEIFF